MNETQLISFYVSKLGSSKQIMIYALHLEKIVNNDERKQALKYAEDNGLNVYEITKQVVESIRKRPNELMEQQQNINKLNVGFTFTRNFRFFLIKRCLVSISSLGSRFTTG